jgi:hypothetical protein
MTTASAMAMWHVVEKKWLLRNNHYVAANAAPAGGRPEMAAVNLRTG